MGNPIKHNYKCKSKKPCLIVTKRGDNLCEIQNQEPENCDLSCKPCKPCLKVTKKGNDLVELQHPEHSEESSSECENVCEKPCFVVVKKGDELTKIHIGEPEHIILCDDNECHDLHVIQHCEGDTCDKQI